MQPVSTRERSRYRTNSRNTRLLRRDTRSVSQSRHRYRDQPKIVVRHPSQPNSLRDTYSDSGESDYETVNISLDRAPDGLKRYPASTYISNHKVTPKNSPTSLPWGTYLHPSAPDFRETFLKHLISKKDDGQAECTLLFDNVIAKFVAAELEPGSSIWDLVVLTGGAKNTWATTCGDYVTHTWPYISEHLRSLFEMLSQPTSEPLKRNLQGRSHKTVFTLPITAVLDLNRRKWARGEGLSLTLASEKWQLLHTAEALSWLIAIVQKSRIIEPFASSVVLEVLPGQSNATFRINSRTHAAMPVSDSGSNCWTQLVPSTPSAVDFKTPPRNTAIEGMEVTFELMCFLCGLEYEVTEEGGIVLYGHNSLVYPVRQIDDCVEWHFQSRDGERGEGRDPHGARLLVDDLEQLYRNKRHFLGLWSDPKVTLGTELQNAYEVQYSGAQEVRETSTADGQSFGGTISLPKVLSFNWNRNYTIAHHRKSPYVANFESKLQSMINSPVILYSISEKRAWMVSYISVLLHLTRCRAKFQHVLGYDVPACNPSADGGKAAFETIMSCYPQSLRRIVINQPLDDTEDKVTIKDKLNEVWTALDSAKRESYKARRWLKPCLVGYDMADIANVEETMRMKRKSIGSFASGWTPLLAEVSLTLFYEGVYDPIISRHRRDTECSDSLWETIPSGFNLLTASMPCLLRMSTRHNRPGIISQLTEKYQWRCPNSPAVLFGTCKRREQHVCGRLQEVVSRTRKSPPYRAIHDNPKGAVVFRYDLDMHAIEEAIQDAPPERRRIDTSIFPTRTNVSPILADEDSGYSSRGSRSVEPSMRTSRRDFFEAQTSSNNLQVPPRGRDRRAQRSHSDPDRFNEAYRQETADPYSRSPILPPQHDQISPRSSGLLSPLDAHSPPGRNSSGAFSSSSIPYSSDAESHYRGRSGNTSNSPYAPFTDQPHRPRRRRHRRHRPDAGSAVYGSNEERSPRSPGRSGVRRRARSVDEGLDRHRHNSSIRDIYDNLREYWEGLGR